MENISGFVIENIKQQKNLCKKVKSLVNTKSTLITKKSIDLKTF